MVEGSRSPTRTIRFTGLGAPRVQVPSRHGFTLIEMVFTVGILLLALAVSLAYFRNSRHQAAALAGNLTFHMKARKAAEKVKEILRDGTEVVKPPPGSTLPFVLYKDLTNQLKVLYFEKTANPKEGPFQLVEYVDTFSGSHQPDSRNILFGNVKEGTFSTLSPGMVVAQLIMRDPSGKDLSFFVEAPLKNLGTVLDD